MILLIYIYIKEIHYIGLFSKPEIIILKESNDAQTYLDKLKSLQQLASGDLQNQIQKEIALTQAGIIGEENILFELKHSNMDMIVLHDIYIETHSGLGAQIDFIVITAKIIFLIECKNLVGNIEIDSNGAFIRTIFYGHTKQKEGIYSPITQSQRHYEVLKEARIETSNWLKGISIKYNFSSFYKPLVVLANPKTIVNDRYAKKEIKQQVIRADQLVATIKDIVAHSKELHSSKKEMIAIAQSLLNMNNDTRKDYTLKYERLLKETKASVSSTENASNVSVPLCPKCGAKLVIRTAQKGANVGKQFYGCSSFPKCKFTLNI